MYTALSIALSRVFHIKDNPYLPCPAVIKFHNITYTLTCYTHPALLMHSTVSTYVHEIPYLPCSVATMLQLSTTVSIHKHALHTQDYPPHCLPQPSYVCTPLTQGIVGKMAQDIRMVESIVVSFPSSLVGF